MMHLNAAQPHAWVARAAQPQKTTSPDDKNSGDSNTTTIVLIVVGSVVAIVLVGVVWICWSRRAKKSPILEQADDPKKKGFFGRVAGRLRGGRYEQASGHDADSSHQLNPTQRRNRDVEQASNTGNTGTAAVDRNTSVRSIMTLPAYRQMAGNNEQVLGREGERDGVDVIIDLPNQEEEEELRDQEMETMYQIRTTRRQLLAEREERRTQRLEARRRNDAAALEDIRARTRAANQNTAIADLRSTVDQIKDTRNRSVSSVSYADVGVARHDGTRIRANSTESERVGLLSDAGSITLGHNRGRSASSAASGETDFVSLTPTASRASRGDSLSGGPWVPNVEGRSGSSLELTETDLGDTAMPPPEYQDVSLEEGRSTTPQHEPPPDYPGPYRSASQRTQRSLTTARQSGDMEPETETHTRPMGRGVGGVPQLPSLRISRLPEIVIEPSSAHPRDESRRQTPP